METFYWTTPNAHWDNNETMSEYLACHLPAEWKIVSEDGTMAEVQSPDGVLYEAHAKGNGDSFNHAIDFVLIETEAAQ